MFCCSYSQPNLSFFLLPLLFHYPLLHQTRSIPYPRLGRCVLNVALGPSGRIVLVGILCAVQIKLRELASVLRSAAACLALAIFWVASCVFLRIDISCLRRKLEARHKACNVLSWFWAAMASFDPCWVLRPICRLKQFALAYPQRLKEKPESNINNLSVGGLWHAQQDQPDSAKWSEWRETPGHCGLHKHLAVII